MPRRLILVGEGPNPTFVGFGSVLPLFGNPTRVLCRVLDIKPRLACFEADLVRYAMLRRIARLENLCRGVWDLREAESHAAQLMVEAPTAVYVLLGRRVARAFGAGRMEFFVSRRAGDATWWLIPHPSGLNHMWNDPATHERAGVCLRQAVDEARRRG